MSSRVTLAVNGTIFGAFLSLEITRDLQQVAGTFRAECLDAARAFAALGSLPPGTAPAPLKAGDACTIAIDGETVLKGHISRVRLRWTAHDLACEICGRDATGDLVDCTPLPEGPSEFRNQDLPAIAGAICKPFGIPVRAEVDTGAPFRRFGLHPYERALEALEKAARQRAVLITSDGVGGLLLTRGGASRAPAPLRVGDNVQAVETIHSDEQRFSDYWVKGQTAANDGQRGAAPAMTAASVPTGAAAAPAVGALTTGERAGTVMTGHAIDPEITRYRPTVRMVKTQSGGASCQAQAEWALRVARGQADRLTYRVLDWRAGAGAPLWKPNQVAAVYDPYTGINRDMLIAGCAYTLSERGLTTSLRVVGRTAYDLVDTTIRQRGPSVGIRQHHITTAVKRLRAP